MASRQAYKSAAYTCLACLCPVPLPQDDFCAGGSHTSAISKYQIRVLALEEGLQSYPVCGAGIIKHSRQQRKWVSSILQKQIVHSIVQLGNLSSTGQHPHGAMDLLVSSSWLAPAEISVTVHAPRPNSDPGPSTVWFLTRQPIERRVVVSVRRAKATSYDNDDPPAAPAASAPQFSL